MNRHMILLIACALLGGLPGYRVAAEPDPKPTSHTSRWTLKECKVDEAILRKYPEQVVLVTSVDTNGKPNIITVGWTMFCSGTPPMVAIAIGKTRYSHDSILKSGCFGYAFPDAKLKQAMLYCGSQSGRNVDKFKETGLTAQPAKVIRAPLIAECPVNFECEVVHAYDSGSHTIFVGKLVAAWQADTNAIPPRLYNLGAGEFQALP